MLHTLYMYMYSTFLKYRDHYTSNIIVTAPMQRCNYYVHVHVHAALQLCTCACTCTCTCMEQGYISSMYTVHNLKINCSELFSRTLSVAVPCTKALDTRAYLLHHVQCTHTCTLYMWVYMYMHTLYSTCTLYKVWLQAPQNGQWNSLTLTHGSKAQLHVQVHD